MYISPNTEILILQGVPLSKTYEHTVRYNDANAQYNGFYAYKKYTLNNYSYQRTGLGTIRVNLPFASLYNCNYMMFKNNSYENKWFYAFITGCGYVSNEVTEVYYEIDVMQTFCYDYTFRQCFIERAHEETDIIYDNTQPEGLELGPDYRINSNHSANLVSSSQNNKKFLIIATTNQSGVKPSGSVVGNTVYVLSRILCTGVNDVIKTVQAFIDNGIAQNIIGVYTLPDISDPSVTFTRYNKIDGYTPKNMKLYSYPFSFIEMNNRTGDSLELKYECFYKRTSLEHISSLTEALKFQCFTNYSILPDAKLIPCNYLKGNTDGQYVADLTYGYMIGYSLFPQGAISDDSFKVWLAQNQNSYIASLNAIGQTYDTNMAIAQNAYDMASRTASAGLSANSNSINTALANATMANQTANAINQRNKNNGRAVNLVSGLTQSVGNLAALNPAGAIGSAVGMLVNQNNIDIQSQNTSDTLATQMLTADNSAISALANANLAYSTAMKNASTAQASSALSSATSANIATAALVAKKQDAQHQPSNLRGQVMNSGFYAALNMIGFSIFEKSIRREYAEMIDNYFEKYGYSIRRLKTPNPIARPHWTYIKTCGCNVVGMMSSADIATVNGIYDNGITTWKTLEEVGNYTLDNHEGVITER